MAAIRYGTKKSSQFYHTGWGLFTLLLHEWKDYINPRTLTLKLENHVGVQGLIKKFIA